MGTKTLRVGSVNLHVIDEGSGPAVVLLHGFPDSSRLWRHQIPALVEAGFRVIAPDLRGFGASDKPQKPEAYALPVLCADLAGLLDALHVERAHVVGHDWGAGLGWIFASVMPERVLRFVTMAVGHPNVVFFETGMDQREMSWYMLLFQFKDLAEELLMRNDWKLMRDFCRHYPEDKHWIEDLSRPGAFTAALGIYRANAHPSKFLEGPVPLPPVQAPTLGLWSSGDDYLNEMQMVASAKCVAGPWRYERVEGASHWMQLDRPAHINRLLIDFLRG